MWYARRAGASASWPIPIAKLSEGQYVILYIETPDGVNPFPEVEQRLRQNEKILRYLTVRTDLDLKRAARKGKIKKPPHGSPAPASRRREHDRTRTQGTRGPRPARKRSSGGARSASSPPRASSTSTTRTSTCCGSSCPSAPRCCRGASPATRRATSACWRRRSSARATSRCCPTSPTEAAMKVILLSDLHHVGQPRRRHHGEARLRAQLPHPAGARRPGHRTAT